MFPRLHLFEFEDQPWFPTVIRDFATDYIHFVETRFGLERPILPLLADALRVTGSEAVVDLCSGGSGPVPAIQAALAAGGCDVRFTLTDRFPNLSAFRRAELASRGRVTFVSRPVDARDVPGELGGFRTIFNAFHHFAPADASAILRNAVDAAVPIAIFEVPDRALGVIVPTLLTPVFVMLATPFIRPFAWWRLALTFVVPLVPLTCLWDGVVSHFRAYTDAELRQLAEGAARGSYVWKSGRVRLLWTHARVTYLIGYPATPVKGGPS